MKREPAEDTAGSLPNIVSLWLSSRVNDYFIFGTEQGNTFFQGRDGLLFFIARRAIVDGVNKKCYNY